MNESFIPKGNLIPDDNPEGKVRGAVQRIRPNMDKVLYEIGKLEPHLQQGLFMICVTMLIDGITLNIKGDQHERRN